MAACVGLASPLAACANHSDIVQIGSLLYQKITGGDSEGITRSQADAVPYATLGVRLGSSGEAMFVLGSKSGSDLQWVGGTRFAIATRDGRILRTTGFVHNLTGFLEQTPAVRSAAGVHDYSYDLADLNAYGIAVRCSERDAGRERIVIVAVAHLTSHVIEDCSAPQLDWRFSDEFWKDAATNAVWRSVQYVHPGLDPITTETLRPAS
ncbi:MAG TPA: YjbF family lipoprotein [Rhizomicrobium sp.]